MSTDLSRKFLITGGTGFLGSYLFTELLKRGYDITLLCRPQNGKTPKERVEGILKWFGLENKETENLKVIEGYIDRDGLGLTEDNCMIMYSGISEVIHCASDTDFSERNRKVIEAANIGCLNNVLEFAKKSGACHFHYLSTAYSSGTDEGELSEEISYPSGFTNVYEETKNRAEKLADAFCRENGMRLTIYRPSIVYGESLTGRSRKFNAFYYPVKAISYIKQIMLKDIKEKGGRRAAALGVSMKDEGTVIMPIRIRSAREGSINLIPVDFFVKAMTAVLEDNRKGGIHHIVNKEPGGLSELIEYTSRYFGIEGLEVVFS
ncbi:MAG: SDR family oxidoreductase [Candidatus Delongbacteria bacterium]|nr:SDR family oxidoreductase [Candidatus Delongbacteria bacterium]